MSLYRLVTKTCIFSDLLFKEEAFKAANEAAETNLKNMTATMERQHAKDMEKLNKHIENQEKEVVFVSISNLTFFVPWPAMVAEWSMTPIFQIQVASGRLGPRFESSWGHI